MIQLRHKHTRTTFFFFFLTLIIFIGVVTAVTKFVFTNDMSVYGVVGELKFGNPTDSNKLGGVSCAAGAVVQIDPNSPGTARCSDVMSIDNEGRINIGSVGNPDARLNIGGNMQIGNNTAAVISSSTINYSGSVHNYTVPQEATYLYVKMYGGQGGYGYAPEGGRDGSGGPAGVTTTVIPVTPGETLAINVGGTGGSSTTIGSPGGAGGWNGGGQGGTGYWGGGGGGGGMTDIKRGSTYLAIAGGGGGSRNVWWGGGTSFNAGYGGGASGTKGPQDYNCVGAGNPGTQSAGGAGGVSCGRAAGANGTQYNGGAGSEVYYGGGGGGGGYYGGGGGGSGDFDTVSGSGGGGSGYCNPSLTSCATSTQSSYTGNGKVEIIAVANETALTPAESNRLYFSGGDDWNTYNSDNSDPLFLSRYTGPDQTQLRINVGDDGTTAATDRLEIGTTLSNVWTPRVSVLTTGRVGIGTTNPGDALEIQQTWFDNSATDWGGGLRIKGNAPTVGLWDSDNTTYRYMIHTNSNQLNFYSRPAAEGSSWLQMAYFNSDGQFDLTQRERVRKSGVDIDVSASSHLIISNNSNGNPNITFYREGLYGANFGLDDDNWLSTRGWSAGASGYTPLKVGSVKTNNTYVNNSYSTTANAKTFADWRNNSSSCAQDTWCDVPNRSASFLKTRAESFIRVTYQDTLGDQATTYGVCEWRVLVNGTTAVSFFSDADVYYTIAAWRMANAAHQVIFGEGWAPGYYTYKVQSIRNAGASECLMGWNQTGSFLSAEEVGP